MALPASGKTSENLNLTALQSKIKVDPEGYSLELVLVYNQFKSSLDLFHQQSALNFSSVSGISADSSIAKNLGDRTMFLAHVTPFFPKELSEFPTELIRFLESSAQNLPSGLRFQVTQALVLLINRKIIDISETIMVFVDLQTLGDKKLRKLAFSHIIQSIRHMNEKHRSDPKNKALQNILFRVLQQEEEEKAKTALIILCDLHRRKVWFDERTANAICMACFHASPRIMNAALSFLLNFEKIEDDDTDSDSEDDEAIEQPHVVLNKEAVYKASHKGTTSSKKKKKAKLQRIARSMKKQQRLSSEKSNSNYHSPLNHLKDAQGFAEKLFSRLHTCNERFEVKVMMLKVIARVVGLYQLILLNFYPYIQKYAQPHQKEVVTLLAAAVQACHEMVPPDAVEPLFRQIVNQFVNDKSRPESITVGLNAIREICLRMPLLMTGELLQDLVLYRHSKEKPVSSAARSLLTLFREVCPSLLVKKDRGRPSDQKAKAKPKPFGEVHVASNIPGIELLEQEEEGSSDDDSQESDGSDDDSQESDGSDECELGGSDHEVHDESDGSAQGDEVSEKDDNNDSAIDVSGNEESDNNHEETSENNKSREKKRKFSLSSADKSLRALKRRLAVESQTTSSNTEDGILSNEDHQRIRELMAEEEARNLLTQHGFRTQSSEEISKKRVDAATLEANIKVKLTKEQKLALIREGREERGRYQSRTAIKKKKTGGLSNRQKEHKKIMPGAAKKARMSRTRQEKKIQKQRSGKQFRGRKAWK